MPPLRQWKRPLSSFIGMRILVRFTVASAHGGYTQAHLSESREKSPPARRANLPQDDCIARPRSVSFALVLNSALIKRHRALRERGCHDRLDPTPRDLLWFYALALVLERTCADSFTRAFGESFEEALADPSVIILCQERCLVL